jgi:transaldolase
MLQTQNQASSPARASALRVKIFADGADKEGIASLAKNPYIRGFTTNPTLMKAAGITDYERFAREVVDVIPSLPLSLEVFADDFTEMARQARLITQWGSNVFVKVPVTDTKGNSTTEVIRELSAEGIQLNVTAMTTPAQVSDVVGHLHQATRAYVSVFAGRVADTGRDPLPLMRECLETLADHPHVELIWASPRELLNVVQADEIGCDIITVTHDLLKKLPLLGKDLDEYSLETVQMFHRDATAAGFKL